MFPLPASPYRGPIRDPCYKSHGLYRFRIPPSDIFERLLASLIGNHFCRAHVA